MLNDETFLLGDLIIEWHTTAYVSFLSLYFNTANVCNVLYQVPYKLCYIIYSENVYYFYLNTHANSSTTILCIAVGHIDLLLSFRESVSWRMPYSLRYFKIDKPCLDY